MEAIFHEKEGSRDQQIAQVETEIEKLEGRLFEVDEKFVEGSLERDSYYRLKTNYSEKKETLTRRKLELERTPTICDMSDMVYRFLLDCQNTTVKRRLG